MGSRRSRIALADCTASIGDGYGDAYGNGNATRAVTARATARSTSTLAVSLTVVRQPRSYPLETAVFLSLYFGLPIGTVLVDRYGVGRKRLKSQRS